MEVAKAAFTEVGPDVALEEIARRAGVGIGTLYRHFPTRDALLAEVYRHAVEQLAETAEHLSATHPPVEALREWMRLFVDYIATKQVIAPALSAMVGGTSELYAASGTTIKTAINSPDRSNIWMIGAGLDVVLCDISISRRRAELPTENASSGAGSFRLLRDNMSARS